MTPLVKRLAHACLYSTDLARTETFYTQALGLEVAFRFLRGGEHYGFYVRVAEDQFLEVFLRGEAANMERPPIGHFCLEVESVQAMHDHLKGMDIEVTEPKLGADASWQCWCKDPDGTSIEFHQYTGQSCQHTGRPCVVNW